MGDTPKDDDVGKGKDIDNSTPSVDELQKTIKTLTADNKTKDDEITAVKLTQQGQDKKNTELQGQLNETNKKLEAKLTGDEKKTYEQNKIIIENKELNSKVDKLLANDTKRNLKDLKLNILKDNELNDLSLLDIIAGDDVESFQKNVLAYKEKTSNIEEKIRTDMVDSDDPKLGETLANKKSITREEFDKLGPDMQRKIVEKKITIN